MLAFLTVQYPDSLIGNYCWFLYRWLASSSWWLQGHAQRCHWLCHPARRHRRCRYRFPTHDGREHTPRNASRSSPTRRRLDSNHRATEPWERESERRKCYTMVTSGVWSEKHTAYCHVIRGTLPCDSGFCLDMKSRWMRDGELGRDMAHLYSMLCYINERLDSELC